ncbi:PREDICTED: GEM-like protein 6 [Ipomoea nil]|uniref:GEM-like protein 6 n=1 Tax=Ipomoea nil TaxID=35883 RepID=UPI000901AAEE|nr:PREDICTED: GEM-like protein 6 [Ipomoea nil]
MNPLLQSYARTAGKSHVDVGIPISSAICSFQNSQRRILYDGEGRRQVLTLSNETSKKIRSITFGHKITETIKGKLSLGAKILQVGGVGKIFKRNFIVKDGEKLVKTSQCYLSTTAGPIAGLLFISTDKVAFCSVSSIKLLSANGKPEIIRYKVTIPLRKIKSANESHNVKKPSQKYVQVVTEDKFEFWFMGFINHKRTLRFLQEAIISKNQCQHMLSQTGRIL